MLDLTNETPQEIDAEHQQQGRQIKRHSPQAKWWKDSPQGQNDGIDDSIEKYLDPAERMRRRHLDPRQNHPRQNRKKVDLKNSTENRHFSAL